ncbi:putative inorganic phosphate cotransporter [Cryptotermes secundus]|uniref:Putative inorganic phosphate cotransporter n=2 Tax=Cryptotermes secundus TaxID=105785 RepID=A0A2J7QRJ4_9NEOP|nr:putative inorganic phosphate cotransporter [Cryptotermes secundus]
MSFLGGRSASEREMGLSHDEDLLILPQASEPRPVQDISGCVKARYVMALMGFLGFAIVYAMRVNLSVVIVAMVNNTAIPKANDSDSTDVCAMEFTNETVVQPEGEFVWDESVQGIILGSFFYGYVVTQIPGGRLAELYGGKLVFGLGVLITGILTTLSPLAAKLGTSFFIVIRVLEGLGEGVTFPSMHVMLARWIPPSERSKFSAYVYAGSNFGTIISMPLSGYLCSLEFLGGWPLSFYIFGGLGVVWFMVWLFVVYDTPALHPYISIQEKNHIISQVGDNHLEEGRSIPWKSILTCVPLWAILVTQCGMSWIFYTQLTELPTYMKNVLQFDITQDSMLSTLPYITSWLFGIGFSHIADWLVLKGYLSVLNSYKTFNSIGMVIPSLGLVAVAWVGCDRLAVMLLLAIAGGFSGAVYAGNQMNHIALSPHFAGTMYGITNAAANTCGFLAPYAIGLLINGNDTLTQWRKVFYIAAAVTIVGNLFYVVFASATEQSWSLEISNKIKDEKEKEINRANSIQQP